MCFLTPVLRSAKRLKVACLVSGGVDSCVAALSLKKQGFEVIGVYLNCWNEFDGICGEKDRNDASFVCNKLGIEFKEVNYVREYWNYVFEHFLECYKRGETPNVDVMCNREIKFGRFIEYALNNLNINAIATGHYAGTSNGPFWENYDDDRRVCLLRAKDRIRDQTLFLSRISRSAIERVMFPIYSLTKEDVRKIARENGFEKIVQRKPTTGICFVGKRKFSNFIDDYLEPNYGKMIDIDNNEVICEHKGFQYWTLGQRCTGFSRNARKFFVAHKCRKSNNIYVAGGIDHPSLYSNQFTVNDVHWINGEPEDLKNGPFECWFKFQQKEILGKCVVTKTGANSLLVQTRRMQRCLTPGQISAFYMRDECLGSALIESYSNPFIDRLL